MARGSGGHDATPAGGRGRSPRPRPTRAEWVRLVEALEKALRISTPDFALVLGFDPRAVRKWKRGETIAPQDARLARAQERLRNPPADVPADLRARVIRGVRSFDVDEVMDAVRREADRARDRAQSKRSGMAAVERRLDASVAELRGLMQGLEQDTGRLPAALPQPMTTVFTQDLHSRVRFERQLLDDLRASSADRLMQPLLSSLAAPAFVTRPWAYQERRQRRLYGRDQARQILPLLQARYDAWHRLAEHSEIRWLIDAAGHRRHFEEARSAGTATRHDVAAQLEEMLGLLARYGSRLQVALQRDPIPTTYSVYGVKSATIYGQSLSHEARPTYTGIRGVVTQDPTTVLPFRAAFEADWHRAQRRGGTRAVEAWLRQLAVDLA